MPISYKSALHIGSKILRISRFQIDFISDGGHYDSTMLGDEKDNHYSDC